MEISRELKARKFDAMIATQYERFKAEYLKLWESTERAHIQALKDMDENRELQSVTACTYNHFNAVAHGLPGTVHSMYLGDEKV